MSSDTTWLGDSDSVLTVPPVPSNVTTATVRRDVTSYQLPAVGSRTEWMCRLLGDTYIVACSSLNCSGFCCVDQVELGMFICYMCNTFTCVPCADSHYPFTCEQFEWVRFY